MAEFEPVPFNIAMVSTSGSPPFVALVFDDGAAVALNSVRRLAKEVGLFVPPGDLSELLLSWNIAFPALAELVQILAYDDRARGHRSHFVAEELLTVEMLLPGSRQIFRLSDTGNTLLPVSAQVNAAAQVVLGEAQQKARANVCLGVIMGAACRDSSPEDALKSIAGWTLVTELVCTDEDGLGRSGWPGALVVGPQFVPSAFAPDLKGIEYVQALMATPMHRGDLGDLTANLGEQIASLSRTCAILPGDLLIAGTAPSLEQPTIGEIDTVEALASGFGRQAISLL